MLQVRVNEISQQKWSGGTVQLHTLEGIFLVHFVQFLLLIQAVPSCSIVFRHILKPKTPFVLN